MTALIYVPKVRLLEGGSDRGPRGFFWGGRGQDTKKSNLFHCFQQHSLTGPLEQPREEVLPSVHTNERNFTKQQTCYSVGLLTAKISCQET